jgi:hypothetical protein
MFLQKNYCKNICYFKSTMNSVCITQRPNLAQDLVDYNNIFLAQDLVDYNF